jgi:hypothetical protein
MDTGTGLGLGSVTGTVLWTGAGLGTGTGMGTGTGTGTGLVTHTVRLPVGARAAPWQIQQERNSGFEINLVVKSIGSAFISIKMFPIIE